MNAWRAHNNPEVRVALAHLVIKVPLAKARDQGVRNKMIRKVEALKAEVDLNQKDQDLDQLEEVEVRRIEGLDLILGVIEEKIGDEAEAVQGDQGQDQIDVVVTEDVVIAEIEEAQAGIEGDMIQGIDIEMIVREDQQVL